MANGGFFDDLIKDLETMSIIEASRGRDGKIDPYAAAGMAFGLGRTSNADIERLGTMIGAQGGFSDK